MSIYDTNFSVMTEQLTPPDKRNKIRLDFLKVFVVSIQYYHDLIFRYYTNGFTGPLFDGSSAFNKGNQVYAEDHCVYEALIDLPTPPNASPIGNADWIKILNNWIGVRERLKYNSNKLVLEFALNKWFGTTFRQPTSNVVKPTYYTPKSDIYIDSNSIMVNQFKIPNYELNTSSFIADNESIYGVDGIPNQELQPDENAFTINVPTATLIALSDTPLNRENIIRNFADKYVIAGIKYNIQPY